MGKALLTGSEGLVGSAVKKLAPKELDLICLKHQQADLTNFSTTLNVMEEIRPEKIFHCAAAVAGLAGNMKNPGDIFARNIQINFNVLEAARQADVKRLLSYLSTCIYPDKVEYPLKENCLHSGPPHQSNFAYAHAKRMIDVQSRAYRQEFGSDFITGVGTNIFGPHDNWNLSSGHAVPSLIHKTYLAAKKNEDLIVWGSGKPLREFVFSEDIARLSFWAMNEYRDADPLLFSHGIETGIRELVELIAQKMNFKGKIIFDDSKPDGQFRKPSDTSKLKGLYPEFQFTPLSKALDQTIQWFIEHYPNVRM